jgi:hypothetical protein
MVTTRMLRSVAVAFTLALTAPQLLHSQERGAVALGESVAGLDVTARVLVIGAHPDDEDTQLIAYLARGVTDGTITGSSPTFTAGSL